MSQPDAALLTAFDHWLANQHALGRVRHASSDAVYRAMWQALVAWSVAQHPPIPLRALDAATLARYLASRSGMAGQREPLTPRYQWRLLSLVQRVQIDHALRAALPPQLAARELIGRRPTLRNANANAADELPAVLADGDIVSLTTHLGTLPPRDAPPLRWQALRDLAGAGLQLGAGLGPGEVRALRLTDVECLSSRQPPLPWRLRVPASGSAPAHAVPLTGWAARLLGRWLLRRAEDGLGGDWLFPSTRSGKPWGKVAQFESVRRVLAAAGIADAAGGSFKLRHSFALQQLRNGISADEVTRMLGVIDPGVVLRYQRLLAERPGPGGNATATPCADEHPSLVCP